MRIQTFLSLLFLGACTEKPFGEDVEIGLPVEHEDEEHFTFRLSSAYTEATLYFYTPELEEFQWKQVELTELGTGTEAGESGFTLYNPPREGWVAVVVEARTPATGESANLPCGWVTIGDEDPPAPSAGDASFDINHQSDPDYSLSNGAPPDCVASCNWYPEIEEGEGLLLIQTYPDPPNTPN